MSLEENKELVRRFFGEVMNTGNADAVGNFLVPNSFFFGFMQKFVVERLKGFPDGSQVNIDELFGEDDKVTACTTFSGTNSGPFLGHPPTSKLVTINSIFVFTVRNGKIISMNFASDMAQQLWVPAPT